jgi:endonuclease/exonuclease/phosphatase family metal-dependent hydrolase
MTWWRSVRSPQTTALACLAAIALVIGLAGDAQATPLRPTYLQFNLCGNACNRGGLAVVDRLTAAIRERSPMAVTLNEVCQNQYDHLLAGLPGYHGRFDPTGPHCRNSTRYGNAILIRSPDVALVGSWALPNPGGDETRRLLCLRTGSGRPLTVCVTHISNVDANVGPQVEAVARRLHGRAPLLLGGDFNTDPGDPRLDPLYSNCYRLGTGDFREADSTGCAARAVLNQPAGPDVLNEDTYRRHKFDDIFLSDVDFSDARAEASDADAALSDHDPLWATAVLHA